MSAYVIKPISSKTIDQAYPLAKVLAPNLRRQEWQELCCEPDPSPFRKGEKIVVALNARGYVKGLCFYCVRDHSTYGRLLDVPILVVASAADAEDVAEELLNFLWSVCDASICSSIRFWTMGRDVWRRRLDPEEIRRNDHGVLMAALASFTDFEKTLQVHTIGIAEVIARFSK